MKKIIVWIFFLLNIHIIYANTSIITDDSLNWTNSSRLLILKCISDDLSWCKNSKVTKRVYNNWLYSLSIQDRAGHKVTQKYLIKKIDKTLPNLNISYIWWNNWTFYASDNNILKLSFSDDESWIKFWRYSIDNDNCWDWIDINNWWKVKNKIVWVHNIYLCVKDKAWNSKKISKSFIIIPNNDLKVNYKWLDKTSVYATDKESDKIQVCVEITDNYWNEINKEYLVGNNNVIIEEWVKDLNNRQVLEVSDISFKNSNFCFKINSFVPANKKLKFKIKVPLHKEDLSLDFNGRYKNLLIETQKLNFKFPLKVNLSSDETLQLWKMINFNLDFINNGNLNFSNWRVYLSINNLKLENWHYFKDFVVLDNRISSSDLKAKFKGIIDANSNTLKSPKLKISWLPVAYSISWKFVKYKLQDSNEIGGNCNLDTLWVKVKWTLQGQWKQALTWQKWNVSDLTKWNLRKQIRSNAYKLIKWLSSWTEVNWIKYVVWDIELSWDQTYETLIVKDWNVIITWDLNPSKKKLWIIVLKDNYDVKKDYNNAWNVYLDKDVENINAVIYADGAFRSANENWNFYPDNQLEKQLKLYWSLFTRNTIWGAVKWNTNFTLPWGESTTNYKLASLYDLNYIRKVSPQCDVSGKQKENSYSFIIEYDPTIQSNPPKWF